jgi:iron complex outermembrane receptor protein
VRFSQNFRIPNVDDNSNAAWVNMAPKLLDVQTSRDLDIGTTIQFARSHAELAYFNSHVNNEIGYDPSQWGNVNFAPTRREGFNLRYKLFLSSQWTFRASWQTVNAKFVEGTYNGNRVPNVANNSGNLSLDYGLSARQTLTATTRFASGHYMAGDFNNQQAQVPGYAVQDLSYRLTDKQWSLNATLGNVFNKAYADVGIYQTSTAYYSLYRTTVYPNPGRNLSLVGRYNF